MNARKQSGILGAAAAAAILVCAIDRPLHAQSPADPAVDGALGVLKVQGHVWLIGGAGANITVQAGEQGLVVVDTGASAMSDKVIAAIRGISTRPIRYIINTSKTASRSRAPPMILSMIISNVILQ